MRDVSTSEASLLICLAAAGPGGVVESFSPAAASMLGRDARELRQFPFEELVVPEDRPHLLDLVKSLETERSATTALRLRRPLEAPVKLDVTAHRLDLPEHDAPRLLLMLRYRYGAERAAQLQDAFARVALQLSAVRTPTDAAMAILEVADELFGWDACLLNLYPPGLGQTLSVINIDTIDGKRVTFPNTVFYSGQTSMSRRVMEEGAVLLLAADGEPGPDYPLISFGDTRRQSASLMFVPIRKGSEAFGVLSIQSYTHNKYRPEDLQTLQTLADHCSGAFERIVAEEKLRRQSLLTQAFADLGKELAAATTQRETAQIVLRTADRLFGWDAAYVTSYSPQHDKVSWLLAYDLFDGKRTEVPPQNLDEPPSKLIRTVLNEGAKLILRTEEDLQSIDYNAFGNEAKRCRSLMLVPIRMGASHVGIVSIQSYTPGFYNAEHLATLQALADHCSGALARTEAQHGLRRFLMAIEQAPSSVIISNANGIIEYVNQAFVTLTGYTRDEAIGSVRPLSAIGIEAEEEFPDLFAKLRAGFPINGVFTNRKKNGEVYYEGKTITPLRDVSGAVTHYVETGRDITDKLKAERALKKAHEELEARVKARTEELSRANAQLIREVEERKRAEEELERSLSLLRATLESTTDGIMVLNLEGQLVSFNQKWLQMWGIPFHLVEDLPAVALNDLLASQLCEPLSLQILIGCERERRASESFRLLELRDGRIFECYSKSSMIGGKSVGRVWSFRDVTQRKRDEEALSRSEAIYREAIENASGVPYRWLYNEQRYDFMGDGVRNLLGLPPHQATKKAIESMVVEYIVLDPDAPKDIREYRKAVRRGEIPQYRVDLRIRTPDGQEKWLNDCSVPVRDPKTGELAGTLGILQDITERKRAEYEARLQQDRLIQSEKLVALGTLVSGVAHEINNPNNFIMLNAPILLDAWRSAQPILDEYYEEHGDFLLGGLNYSDMRSHIPSLFHGVLNGAQRIRSIVQELRDFSRPNPNSVREPVDVNSMVRSALILVQNQVSHSTRQFSLSWGENLPPILGSFQRLEQVVINLIQNACQALTDKEQPIRLATLYDEEQEMVVIEVEDRGRGIDPEHLKQITDPFFTTKRDSGGTGLGLSISSNIVHNHGGVLEFESEVGKGTIARVKFLARRYATPPPIKKMTLV